MLFNSCFLVDITFYIHNMLIFVFRSNARDTGQLQETVKWCWKSLPSNCSQREYTPIFDPQLEIN